MLVPLISRSIYILSMLVPSPHPKEPPACDFCACVHKMVTALVVRDSCGEQTVHSNLG